jgi:hypothetical protein
LRESARGAEKQRREPRRRGNDAGRWPLRVGIIAWTARAPSAPIRPCTCWKISPARGLSAEHESADRDRRDTQGREREDRLASQSRGEHRHAVALPLR